MAVRAVAPQTRNAPVKAAALAKTAGTQYAALPWRLNGDAVEILLITSRRTRRWIVPKGWPIEGLGAAGTAAREALEEAGISGEIDAAPLGAFHYFKLLRGDITMPCRVDLFPLKVTRQRKSWAEKEAREARWFAFPEAARRVTEPQLRRLILKFGAQMAARPHQRPI